MYCMPIIIALPCISYAHPKTEVWRQAWWRLSIMKGSVVAIMFHGSKPDLSLFSGHHAGLPWIPGQRCNQIGNSQHDWHILVQMRVNLLNHDKCSSETDSNIINQRACPNVPIFCYWRDCLCPPHLIPNFHTIPSHFSRVTVPIEGLHQTQHAPSPTQVAICHSDMLRSPAPGLSMSESRPVSHLCPALPWP